MCPRLPKAVCVCFRTKRDWLPGCSVRHLPVCLSLAGASSADMEPSYGGGLFDMVKGGAGRLFSNLKDNLKDTLKDTSSRVIQSVTRYVCSALLS